MPQPLPPSARNYALRSTLLAHRAGSEALAASRRGGGLQVVSRVVAAHQAAAAVMGQASVAQALQDQAIAAAPDGQLNPAAFTTSIQVFEGMVGAVDDRRDLRFATAGSAASRTQVQYDAEFQRLVGSLVQDAGRAAQSVATAVRPEIGHVRVLTPPSCSRCAVLAGRVYRYSEGFLRHPHCDCVMVATTDSDGRDLVQDPVELARSGLVTGLSKADMRAVAAGADLGQVVNIRLRSAGLRQSGRVLARRGRLTPEGIYARARTRDEAVQLLGSSGYIY